MLTQLTESLWGDEAFSAMAVQKPFGEMVGVVMKDTAPPLFYVLGATWGRLFGFSEISLRSLSLLLILGASLFAGLIVYHLQKDKKTAILVSLLAFLTPFLEPFAFEWRMYALLAFTTVGSIYFFVKRSWVGYVLFTTAALYTHHFALFTLASQGIWYLMAEFDWKKPKTYLSQLKPFIAVLLLYTFWLYPMYLQIKRVQGSGFWLGIPKVRDLVNLLYQFLVGGVAEKFRPVSTLVIGLLLLFKSWKKVGRGFVELLILFLGPVFIAYAVSHAVTPVFYDRYLLATAIGMAVLIGLGVKQQLRVLLIALVIFYGVISFGQFTHPKKNPFRDLAKVVASEITTKDSLININGASHHLWESKYYGIPAPIYNPGQPLPLYVGTAQMTDSDVIKSLPTTKRIGTISDRDERVSLPGYHDTSTQVFGNLKFMWWEKK